MWVGKRGEWSFYKNINVEDIRPAELKQIDGKLSGKNLEDIKPSREELESYQKDCHNDTFPPLCTFATIVII